MYMLTWCLRSSQKAANGRGNLLPNSSVIANQTLLCSFLPIIAEQLSLGIVNLYVVCMVSSEKLTSNFASAECIAKWFASSSWSHHVTFNVNLRPGFMNELGTCSNLISAKCLFVTLRSWALSATMSLDSHQHQDPSWTPMGNQERAWWSSCRSSEHSSLFVYPHGILKVVS